jgi:hypothetical protein
LSAFARARADVPVEGRRPPEVERERPPPVLV